MSAGLLISAFGLGLLSSFHCVGMCGPIAFSLPAQRLPPISRLTGLGLYNAGRITLYTLMGVVFGLAGRRLYLAGLQQWFSIAAGAGMLAVVICVSASFRFERFHFSFFSNHVQRMVGRLLHRPRVGYLFLLGMANGLLPCGMVYLAITAALATGSVVHAALFMLLFGLGTFPAMFLLSYFQFRLKLSVRMTAKKMMPFVMAAMGTLLILRGLGLGIPYVSPLVPAPPHQAFICH